MGDFAAGSDSGDKKTVELTKGQADSGINGSDQSPERNAAGKNGTNTSSPFRLIEETFNAGRELIQAQTKAFRDAASKLILDKLPLVLDAPLPALATKSYSMKKDLDAEAARKLANAPDRVKDFYKGFREAQFEHEPTGLDAVATILKNNPMDTQSAKDYTKDWAEMNAWLAFPVNDADCEEGRKLYTNYLIDGFDKALKGQEQDIAPLAKLYSLILNDHDYLHNEDEITRRDGMHHLPKDFVCNINGQGEKHFNVQAIAEKQMRSMLKSSPDNPTYKMDSTPEERAVMAFHAQVLRQVSPDYLLDDTHRQDRNNIISQFANAYKDREYDLSQAGVGVWEQGMIAAVNNYVPEIKATPASPPTDKFTPGLQLTGAEELYKLFNFMELRQLTVEAHEMRTIAGKYGKPSELAYPDQERLHEFALVKPMLREYREGQIAAGRRFQSHVFQAATTPHINITNTEKTRLKNWDATPLTWQAIYWNDDPNTQQSRIEREVIRRFPNALQCSISQQGAEALRKWRGNEFIPGDESDRLTEWLKTLTDPVTKQPCVHDQFPRDKSKL